MVLGKWQEVATKICRWLEFGEQMARNDGKIVDLFAANHYWHEVTKQTNEIVIFLRFQKIQV